MTNIMPAGPLAYEGGVAIPYLVRADAPTSANFQFNVPTIWITPSNGIAYILTAKPQNVANWVTISGSAGTLTTLTGDLGGAVSPDSGGNINIIGDGSFLTVSGTPIANTLQISPTGFLTVNQGGTGAIVLTGVLIGHGSAAVTGNSVTQNNVLIGASNNGIGSVAPSATSGVPLVSQGSASAPHFGTAVVAGGGTGLTSTTAYAVLCGGTTTTAPLQSIAGVGTSGQVLTSNGAGMLPTFQASPAVGISSVVTQVFTTSGTYTPTSGMLYCNVEIVGGGGGGGGGSVGGGSNAAGGGGGGGGYSRYLLSAASIGVSQSVVIGGSGAGGSGNAIGNAGGTTTFGSIFSASGGGGGGGSGGSSQSGGSGGDGVGGNLNIHGGAGGFSMAAPTSFAYCGGAGGSSFFGGGGAGNAGQGNGQSGGSYGGGGAGAGFGGGGSFNGGSGAPGVCIITEYVG